MKVVVTGSSGLLGRHAAIRLRARNAAALFAGKAGPFDCALATRADFAEPAQLAARLADADCVLHFAGMNRGPDAEVEATNPALAEALLDACEQSGARPHIVHANSVHAGATSAYGRGKAKAADLLARAPGGCTDLILPHVFGEGARPRYNNVTATFIAALIEAATPRIDPDAMVDLLHAGCVADLAIEAAIRREGHALRPAGRAMAVSALWQELSALHAEYTAGRFPDLADPFTLALFNSYRAALPIRAVPLVVHADNRGNLFETVKGGGGQSFVSTTHPGITRGEHFHLNKVERFVVLQGDATIRWRPVLEQKHHEIRVSGDRPAAVDIPTLTTHSIENTGERPLLTLFWAHAPFDPTHPDTFAESVIR